MAAKFAMEAEQNNKSSQTQNLQAPKPSVHR